LPGGHIEEGENQIEALHRECLEEVGVKIKDVEPLGYQKITKKIIEEKYPYLESYQEFFTAKINEDINKYIEIKNGKTYIVNRKLESDSDGSLIIKFDDFLKEKQLNNEETPCYYIDLLKIVKKKLELENNKIIISDSQFSIF
jgi:ADP-ribose pyrophosphatase YjhB (NUDIX family)